MKRIELFSILFCLASSVVFGLYLVNERQVLDNVGPEISMDSDTVTIRIADEESKILEGVTAMDNVDGDTTEYLLVEQLTNFLETGRRQATIAAFDKAGNVTKTVREVVYEDYVSPHFALEKPFYFPEGVSDIEKYITAEDCLDGDITSKIRISSEEGISVSRAGTYEAIFTVSNSAGDTVKLPVTVEIYNTSEYSRKPVILLEEYLVYIEKGQTFDAERYVEEIYFGNNNSLPLEQLDIDNPVDSSVPGVYEVTYSYSWEESLAGTTRLLVVVEE